MSNKPPEKVEENKFVLQIKTKGWPCIKLQLSAGIYGETGWNDRLVLAPCGVAVVFEFKRDGEGAEKTEATKIQNYRHKILKELGHETYVVYTAAEAGIILARLIREARARLDVLL